MVEGHPPDSLRVVREGRCAASLPYPSHISTRGKSEGRIVRNVAEQGDELDYCTLPGKATLVVHTRSQSTDARFGPMIYMFLNPLKIADDDEADMSFQGLGIRRDTTSL